VSGSEYTGILKDGCPSGFKEICFMCFSRVAVPICGVIAAMLAAGTARADILISDGDFTNWSYNSFGTVGGSTAMFEATGGDPGANIQITTLSPGGQGGATAIKDDYTTTGVDFEGSAFTFSFDVSNSANAFGNGQQIELLVQQGGNIYGDHVGKTGIGPTPPTYYSVSFNGTIAASDFSLLNGSGSATPDFSGGTATQFGIGAYNISTPALTQNYDNYSLDIATTSVPEPTPVVWLSTVLTGTCLLMRRRHKRSAAR
jgi:hypothetical protein